MKTTAFLPLSPTIKWVTIIASIIILGSIIYLGYLWFNTHNVGMLFSLILITAVTLGTLVLIPRKLTVTDKEINIHLLAWKITIPADEIEKIEHYPHGIDTHRIVGAGGFFGNLGLFTCKECGKHLSLITDPMDVCIITRRTKMPVVVSVADHSIFNTISDVQEMAEQ